MDFVDLDAASFTGGGATARHRQRVGSARSPPGSFLLTLLVLLMLVSGASPADTSGISIPMDRSLVLATRFRPPMGC